MHELLSRLKQRPGLSAQVIFASLLINALGIASSLYVTQVLNRFVSHGVTTTLITLTVGVLLAIFLELGFRWVRMKLAVGLSAEPDRRNALGAFGLMITARLPDLEKIPAGQRRGLMQGLEQAEQTFAPTHFTNLIDLPFSLVFLSVLWLLSPELGMVALGFLVLVIVLGVFGQWRLKPMIKEMREVQSKGQVLMGAAVGAADTIRVFNAGEGLVMQYAALNQQAQVLKRRVSRWQGIVQNIGQSAQGLMTVAIIALGALLVRDGALDVGSLIGANILAARALAPVQRFAALAESLTKANVALQSLRQFTAIPTEAEEGAALKAFKGAVQIEDLAYTVEGHNTPLFEGLNVALQPGEVLVVVGPSGSGKSTLMRLLAGLIPAQRGSIKIDGVSLQQFLPAWWRKQLIYLPQEPVFLSGTLRQNLDPEGQIDVDDILKRSGADAVIHRLAEGLDTRIQQAGREFSVGERRRLALARAMATGGQLAILDEPSEGLDDEGVRQVFEVMIELARAGHTLIVSSHDPRMIQGATRVLDLGVKPMPQVREGGV